MRKEVAIININIDNLKNPDFREQLEYSQFPIIKGVKEVGKFQIAGSDETFSEFNGILLKVFPIRVLFENAVPICFSSNANIPDVETPIAENCFLCKMPTKLTDPRCRYLFATYWLTDKGILPCRLTISQINHKYFRQYLGILTSKGLLAKNVITLVRASQSQSKRGFPYCQINYELISETDKKMQEVVEYYSNLISRIDLKTGLIKKELIEEISEEENIDEREE